MSVQPIEFTPSEKDMPDPNRGKGKGLYTEIDVPGDYEGILVGVDTYDKRDEGKSHGWIFTYSVETPSGGAVTFDEYLSFGENARWKLIEIFDAHGDKSEPGVKRQFNPETILNTMVGLHIDFPRDGNGDPTSTYRRIQSIFEIREDEEINDILSESLVSGNEVAGEGIDANPESPLQL